MRNRFRSFLLNNRVNEFLKTRQVLDMFLILRRMFYKSLFVTQFYQNEDFNKYDNIVFEQLVFYS
jgi:hypothetical protein